MRAGVDEAGRGPLAGPVVAAAVILDGPIPGLDDSKKLSPKRRESLALAVRDQARAWAIGMAEPAEIDALNIHHATLLAMRRAVESLSCPPSEVLVDGRFVPPLQLPARAVVGGDALVAEISAASILAKTTRDALLVQMEADYPGYGFARHKGYPTAEHLAALRALGPCPEHRRSFAPVAQRLLDLAPRGSQPR